MGFMGFIRFEKVYGVVGSMSKSKVFRGLGGLRAQGFGCFFQDALWKMEVGDNINQHREDSGRGMRLQRLLCRRKQLQSSLLL